LSFIWHCLQPHRFRPRRTPCALRPLPPTSDAPHAVCASLAPCLRQTCRVPCVLLPSPPTANPAERRVGCAHSLPLPESPHAMHFAHSPPLPSAPHGVCTGPAPYCRQSHNTPCALRLLPTVACALVRRARLAWSVSLLVSPHAVCTAPAPHRCQIPHTRRARCVRSLPPPVPPRAECAASALQRCRSRHTPFAPHVSCVGYSLPLPIPPPAVHAVSTPSRITNNFSASPPPPHPPTHA
jgi:hypothetical protein